MPALGSEGTFTLALENETVIRALGKWCQVGRKRMEKRWDGYSFFRKGMSFKGKTATGETEPCPRLYRTTEQTSRT